MQAKPLDLLIIKPGSQKILYGDLSRTLSALEPPLWAALLAAFVRDAGFSVKIIDMEIGPDSLLPILREESPRLAAIAVSGTNPSASTMNMIGARAVLGSIRRSNASIATILMGLHPSALPERTLKEEPVDMVCQGEGFHTLTDILSGRANKGIKGLWYRDGDRIKSSPMAELADPDKLPSPAFDLLPMPSYRAHNWHSWTNKSERQPYGVIYTSLGCPYNCSFCCINALFGVHKIRQRSPDLVIEDIACLVDNYGVKNIKIIDEMFAFKEAHVDKLCDLIVERGYDLNIWAYARVDTLTKGMVGKMKSSGINWLALGFESGSKKVRDGVTKGRFGNKEVLASVRMIRDAGIGIIGNFIFGLPNDDIDTMNETLEMAKELNCEYTNFYVCMAYPGSRLYGETDPAYLPESWEGYSQFGYETKPLPTKCLRPEEVLAFRDRAFIDFYGSRRYQDMMAARFGTKVQGEIKNMLEYKLARRLLSV
ncbi:MAG: radical SAM protein [Candidatus Omnitrophota bacterium]